MKLHHVSDAEHAEPLRDQRQGASDPVTVFGADGRIVHALVQVPAFEGEAVLLEDALDMDQRALPRAEDHVLQAREREQVGFGG